MPESAAHARVDTVGSLVRPDALISAFASADAGAVDEDELLAAQDDAIREVIAKQDALGLPIVTDGEFRRRHFMESFADVAGFVHGRLAPVGLAVITGEETGANGSLARGYLERSTVDSRLKLLRNHVLDEFAFARNHTNRVVKVTLLNCGRIAESYDAEGSQDTYAGPDEFLDDVIRVQREIVAGLVEAGCTYVHIDAPGYTLFVDSNSLDALVARGEDPAASLARTMRADNAVIAGFPGVTFGLHVCRGNFRGRWAREGAYDAIAEQLYGGLAHDRLLLEYDTERSGGFESLRFLPKGKIAVLGLISTKSPRVESVDELERRIEEASAFIGVDQLAISPQCGFGSVLDGNPVDEATQWRKLEVMMATAERVWG